MMKTTNKTSYQNDILAMKFLFKLQEKNIEKEFMSAFLEQNNIDYVKEVSSMSTNIEGFLPKNEFAQKGTYLKRLIVYNNTDENKEVRRDIIFKLGVNFIVDDAQENEKANNTGKTTALKIIDVCLGARNKKYIYTDSSTNSIITPVFDAIEAYNITADLVISNSFLDEENSEDHILTVELKSRGNRSIDGIKLSQTDYLKILNGFIFLNNENKPTFRQLIPKFVRIDLKEDISNHFLKFIGNYPSTSTYRIIYDYLFGFSKTETDIELIMEKEQQLKEDESYLKQIKKRHGDSNIINQEIDNRKTVLLPKEERLEILISGDDFQDKVKELNIKRAEFTNIENNINDIMFETKKIDDYLLLLEQTKQVIKVEVLKELYEVTSSYADLNKKFDDLLAFNKQLSENQVSFQESRRKELNHLLYNLTEENQKLKNEYRKNLGLIRDLDINEYNSLSNEVTALRKEISELETINNDFSQIEANVKKINEELSEIKSNSKISADEIRERRNQFNKFFMDNTEKICGERYNVIFEEEGFPIRTSPMQEGLGSGRKKSLVVAFDISYLEYAEKYDLPVPHFIIHDVLENIDQRSFSAIVQKINDMVKYGAEVQYIGSILSEKIRNYDFIITDMIVETVSEDDRFLRI